MASSPRYLKLRHHTWFYQIGVPADVRQHFDGRAKIIKTTGFRDLADAQPVALRWAGEHQRQFRLLRGGTTGTAREVYRDKLAALEAGLFGVVLYGDEADDVGKKVMLEIDSIVEAAPAGPTGEPVLDATAKATLAAINDFQRPPKAERPEYAMTFSEAARRALEQKAREVTGHTVGQYRSIYRLFSDYVSDKALRLITKRDAATYIDALAKLSPDWGSGAAVMKMSFAEIRAKYTAEPGELGLSNRTLNKHLVALSGVWEWAKARGEVEGENPFKGLHRKINKKTSQTFAPFDADDLQRLFSQEPARRDLQAVSLVALYAGMRLSEITKLTWEDIKTEDGVAFFDITEAKSEAGMRKVPVHSKLMWLLGRRANDPTQLVFAPGIKPAHFTQHRRACGIEDGTGRYRKVFHSFRKCVVRCLELAGVPESTVAEIVGHEKPGFTFRTYNPQGITLRQRQAVVEKIVYPGLVVPPPTSR